MTNDREAARRARVKRLLQHPDIKLGTDMSLRRHALPDSVEAIELGLKGVKKQQQLDLPACVDDGTGDVGAALGPPEPMFTTPIPAPPDASTRF